MSRLALLLVLLTTPLSAMAGTWRVDNVDLPEILGDTLTIGFTVSAKSGSGTVTFSKQSAQLDANGSTPWVSGKDGSGLSYRARMVKGTIEVEVTEPDESAPVTTVTTTLSDARGEQLVSAALTETAERAQTQERAVR